ncbi:MAG TPA: lytic transglycosylase domain-containing protein, partial [Candidatus Baltobacteraceae bacterium]|nr:lytic transglycosylase domain-containing protein [Candidatus Baltobacteraceae bacterium]
SAVDALIGARLLMDGPRVDAPALAIARAILRTNPRMTAVGALELAVATVRDARKAGLAPEFFAATILQESAYDPHALSSAGAIGIAQFMLGTADDADVDPFDPFDALAGASRLLGSYVRAYAGVFPDPDAIALAAYNAGPGAVARYHGVPPYRETREYVSIIYERWGRIDGYERNPAEFPPLWWKRGV